MRTPFCQKLIDFENYCARINSRHEKTRLTFGGVTGNFRKLFNNRIKSKGLFMAAFNVFTFLSYHKLGKRKYIFAAARLFFHAKKTAGGIFYMQQQPQQLQRVVIKEELLALTGDVYEAAILNNLIFWQGIQNKSDNTTRAKIEAAKKRGASPGHIGNLENSLRNGWFYKSAEEMLDEMLNWGSGPKITRATKSLKEKGFLQKGNNPDPKQKWDRTTWYKIDLAKIRDELIKMGYPLEGYDLPQEVKNEPETASDSNFQNEKCNFQNEKSIFQNENSIFQNERTIPEGISESPSKDFKSNYIYTDFPPAEFSQPNDSGQEMLERFKRFLASQD